MISKGTHWIRFLRQYGPIASGDNMYEEHILRAARRAGVNPIRFTHPLEADVLDTFRTTVTCPSSAILTGTAGDGKSHLCGKVWELIGGDAEEWASDEVYYTHEAVVGGRTVQVHIIRDLTALPQYDEKQRYVSRPDLLSSFCLSVLDCNSSDMRLGSYRSSQKC